MSKNTKNIDANKVGQRVMMVLSLVLFLVYGLSLWFTWDKGFWIDKDYIGNIFGPAFDSISYAFRSWENFIVSTGFPFIFMIILLVVLYKVNTEKKLDIYYYFSMIGILPIVSTLVLYFIMFFNCNPIIAYFYNLSFGSTILLFIPCLVVLTNTCYHCRAFNSLIEVGSKSRTKRRTNYVQGGYRTVTGDIKDDTGTVVGTVEARKYENGYHYTSTSTTTTVDYECSRCGYITTKHRDY